MIRAKVVGRILLVTLALVVVVVDHRLIARGQGRAGNSFPTVPSLSTRLTVPVITMMYDLECDVWYVDAAER